MTIEKAEKRRRIKRGKITHVSLCRRAMNQLPVLLKSADRMQIELLTKMQGDLLHTLVYIPEENGAVAIDFEGDSAPAAVVKQIAHDFLANGGNIDIEHNLQTLGPDRIRIAETFLVQKGDTRFEGWKDYNGRPVNAEGSWAMILKVLDPKLREQVASGEINGVSMFGHAEVELLTKNSPPTNTNTTIMTPEQMQAFAEMLVKGISTALKPVAPAGNPAPVQKEPIAFEGDPLNQEDLAKHMDKVMFASLDLSKPADLAKWQGHVAKRQAELAKAQAKPEDELAKAKADLAKAQEALAKLTKASGAPTEEKPDAGPTDTSVGLSKSEKAQMEAARAAVQKLGLSKRPAK